MLYLLVIFKTQSDMLLTKVVRQTMEADYVASHFRLLKRAGGSIGEGNRLTANKVPQGPRTYCM